MLVKERQIRFLLFGVLDGRGPGILYVAQKHEWKYDTFEQCDIFSSSSK
jgi:hypothetical protein